MFEQQLELNQEIDQFHQQNMGLLINRTVDFNDIEKWRLADT